MKTSTRLLVTLAVIGCALGTASLASAEDGADAGVETPMPGMPKAPLRALREKTENKAMRIQQDIQEKKQGFREDRMEFKDKVTEEHEAMMDERRAFMNQTIEDRKAMHDEVMRKLEDADTPEEKQEILKEAREARADFRMNVKADAEAMRADFKSRRGDLQSERRDLIAERLSAIMNRLVSALERFDQILGRIDSRIQKLADAGVDVSAATDASALASLKVDDAATAVSAAQAAIEAAATSETPRDELENVRTAVRAASEAMKTAHTAIKDVLVILKELALPEADMSSTSDASDDSVSSGGSTE